MNESRAENKKKGVCANCTHEIVFLGKFVNAWVHVRSQSIWCEAGDAGGHVRAAPEGKRRGGRDAYK